MYHAKGTRLGYGLLHFEGPCRTATCRRGRGDGRGEHTCGLARQAPQEVAHLEQKSSRGTRGATHVHDATGATQPQIIVGASQYTAPDISTHKKWSSSSGAPQGRMGEASRFDVVVVVVVVVVEFGKFGCKFPLIILRN